MEELSNEKSEDSIHQEERVLVSEVVQVVDLKRAVVVRYNRHHQHRYDQML